MGYDSDECVCGDFAWLMNVNDQNVFTKKLIRSIRYILRGGTRSVLQ